MRSTTMFIYGVWASVLIIALLSLAGCPPKTEYLLTVAVEGNGTTAPAAGEHAYDAGADVVITPTAAAGWRFAHWEGDVTGSAVPAHVAMDADRSVTAVFVEDAWEADSFTYDVDVAPDVSVIQGADLELLTGSDPETHQYRFNAAGVAGRGIDLSVGRAILIEGIGFRRIRSTEAVGGDVVLETDYVTMPEVIPNGTLGWDYGVEFDSAHIKSMEIEGYGSVAVKDGTPIDIEMTIGEYTYGIKATLDTVTSTFEFTVSKDLAGPAGAKLVASGVINRFRSKDQIEIAQGELQTFGHELTGMRGEATLELVVAATGNDAVNLEFPVTVMKVPFMIGIIPAELNIRIQFVINAAVPADGSARVASKFTYDSDLGFTYDGTTVQAGGRMGPLSFGDTTHETGSSSAISANFGVGFPRVELSLAGDSIVPWAQTAFLVGGSYTFYPACQTADAQFIGAVGIDLGLFGVSLAKPSKTLFTEKKELLRSGDCDGKWDADALEALFTEAPLP